MQREYHQWYSPNLSRNMELLVFGHAGAPVIVFPTSMGRFYQFEDFGMVEAISEHLEKGWIQLYCLDGVDNESWYNDAAQPDYRVARHDQFDRYITDEVLGFIGSKNPNNYLIVTGCSFGAYHSVNYGFRHPDLVRKIVAMSGRYNMNMYLDGFYSDEVYYNNPIDYIGGLSPDSEYAEKLRHLEINLLLGEWDVASCLNETKQLSNILSMKNIPHNLDIWGGADHDWPWWRKQFLKYI